jgi:fermentation-respiration switch protein FrsA (DUF1100 family)
VAIVGLATAVFLPLSSSAVKVAPFRVAVRHISLAVEHQQATGLLMTPYRHQDGDVRYGSLVVFAHGWGDTAASNAAYVEDVVARTGAAAIAMDFRGPRDGWNVRTGAADTLAATRWFKHTHPEIHTTLLWGWSMGGLVSGVALANAPAGTYDYWLSSFGMADDFDAWITLGELDPAAARAVARDAGGCNPTRCPHTYVDRSPSMPAADMPLRRAFFVHGIGDPVVPVAQTREMAAALRRHGVSSDYTTVLDQTEPNGMTEPAGHGHGSGTARVAVDVAVRILKGTEPMTGMTNHVVQTARAGAPRLLTPIA